MPDYNKEKLDQWISELIQKFRDEYEKLDDLEKSQISNIHNYISSCQIEVFWLSDPVEYQIIVLTHNPDRKDMEIIINGPYKGHEFLSELEKVMLEPRWAKAVQKNSPYRGAESGTVKYSDRFAGILYNFLNQIKNSVFLKIRSVFQSGIVFEDRGWCWCFAGNIGELDYQTIIDEQINEMKQRARQLRTKPPEKQSNIQQLVPRLKGYGTFFYPPIWVGKIPEKTFRQKAEGSYFAFPSKAFDFSVNGIKIIVNSDGFLGVATENKEQAIRLLNIIFGIAFLSGHNCLAVRESEIAEIDIDPNSLSISATRMQISSLRTLLMDWFRPTLLPYGRNEIPELRIREFMEKAEKISRSEDLVEQLIFLLEGYTHFNNSEYSQSFIINWLIVEKFLNKLWLSLLDEKQITGDRKGKLTNPNLWSIDDILEILNINEKIDNEEYKLLWDLKDKRNKFVHKGKTIDKLAAEKLLNLCFKIISQLFTTA